MAFGALGAGMSFGLAVLIRGAKLAKAVGAIKADVPDSPQDIAGIKAGHAHEELRKKKYTWRETSLAAHNAADDGQDLCKLLERKKAKKGRKAKPGLGEIMAKATAGKCPLCKSAVPEDAPHGKPTGHPSKGRGWTVPGTVSGDGS